MRFRVASFSKTKVDPTSSEEIFVQLLSVHDRLSFGFRLTQPGHWSFWLWDKVFSLSLSFFTMAPSLIETN
jgi:hypothetical protein